MATQAATPKRSSSKRKLPKSISKCNLEKADALKKKLRKSLLQHKTFGYPHTLGSMTKYNIRLPDLSLLAEDFQKLVRETLVDGIMVRDLEEAKIINFCRTIQTLYPLKTTGDGNCLLHAVSIALWGIHDKALLLRRLVYISLVEDVGIRGFQQRWIKERHRLESGVPDLQLSSAQWNREWDMVVHVAEDTQKITTVPGELPFESLEEIHIFVLANVIQRPIIVLSDSVVRGFTGSTLGPNNFGGIYLPLLWEPYKCSTKNPIVLGYYMGHFTPLVNMEMDRSMVTASDKKTLVGEYVVPLVNKDSEPLHIHFLTNEEERYATNLLQNYLKVVEINWTKGDGLHLLLSARLEDTKIEHEYDLMTDFLETLEKTHTRRKSRSSSERTPLNSSKTSPRNLDLSPKEIESNQTILPLTGPDNDKQGNVPNCDRTPPSSPQVPKPHAVASSTPSGKSQHPKTTKHGSRKQKKSASGANLCENPGCQYYGAAEYGGFCYTCFVESREPVRPSDDYRLRRPTDEYQPSVADTKCVQPGCKNMASVYTLPYCHEHVHKPSGPVASPGPLASPTTYVPSYTDFKCHHGGCKNVASVHTMPYCHEHAQQSSSSQTRIRHNQHETESELSVTGDQCAYPACIFAASKNTYPFCHEHFTPCVEPHHEATASLYTMGLEHRDPEPEPYELSISGLVCTYTGCKNTAAMKTFPFCREHHVQHMPQKGANIYQRGTSLSQYEGFASWEKHEEEEEGDETKHHSLDSSPDNPRRCKVKGCPLFCPPSLDYCAQHLAWKQAQRRSQDEKCLQHAICTIQDCQNPANSNCGGLCKPCFLDESLCQTDSDDDGADDDGDDEKSSDEDIFVEDVKSGTDVKPRVQKKKTPNQPVTKSSPHDTKKVLKETVPSGQESTPGKLCIFEACRNEGKPTFNGLCEKCHHILRKSKQSSRPRILSRDHTIHDDSEASLCPCITEGCDGQGAADQQSLCSKCYSTWQRNEGLNHVSDNRMKHKNNRANVLEKSEIAPPSHSLSNKHGISSPAQKQVRVVPHNDRMIHQREKLPPSEMLAHLANPTINGEQEPDEGLLALQRLENSARASRRKCKITKCKNFRNPSKNGYCNTCFVHKA